MGVFLDENARPDLLQEFFFGDDVSGLFDQYDQSFQVLRRQGNRLPVTRKDLFLNIELISAALVNVLCFQESVRRKKFARTSSELLKDIFDRLSALC